MAYFAPVAATTQAKAKRRFAAFGATLRCHSGPVLNDRDGRLRSGPHSALICIQNRQIDWRTVVKSGKIARLPTKSAPISQRQGAAWVDERDDERGDLRVMQAFSSLRAENAVAQAAQCAACQSARVAEGADDALCDDHLSLALGMKSDW